MILLAAAGITYVLVAGAPGHPARLGHRARPAAVKQVRPPVRAAATPAAHPSPALGLWGHIASRKIDPSPLTLPELFPSQFASGGTSYRLMIARESPKCAAAVIGAGLQKAIQRAGCSQVLRGSYLAADRQLMGTIGVMNLRSYSQAETAGKQAGRAQFIAQLPSARGLTSKLGGGPAGDGAGIVEGVTKGHYLILVWGQFTSLRPPRTASQRAEVLSFLRAVISGTANVDLTRRLLTGSPGPAP